MSTTTEPEVKEVKAKAPTIKEVASKVEELTKSVSDLADIVTNLVEGKNKEAPKVEKHTTPEAKNSFPIPVEYREIVDNTLNKAFGIEVNSHSGGSFEFSILVPETYSNAGVNHWELFHEDKRTRIIETALGDNGVRLWTQHVFDNFPAETRSRIAFDRSQP